jgi:hypothetical protein
MKNSLRTIDGKTASINDIVEIGFSPRSNLGLRGQMLGVLVHVGTNIIGIDLNGQVEFIYRRDLKYVKKVGSKNEKI